MKGKIIYVLQFVISALLFLILNKSSINSLIYPFSYSMAFALLWSGVPWWLIMPSYAISSLIYGFDLSNLLSTLFICICLFIPILISFVTKKKIKKYVVCIFLILSQVFQLIFKYNDFEKIIYLAVTILLGVLFFLSCSKLLDSFKNKTFLCKYSNLDCICGAVIIVAISGGLTYFNIAGFEFFKLIVSFILLCVCFCTRKSLTLIIGALFALGSILPSGNVVLVAPILLWSLVIILFKSNQKIYSSLGLIAVEAVGGYLLRIYYSFNFISFLPVIISGVVFFILPSKLFSSFRVLYESKNSRFAMKNVYNQGRELIGRRLENLSNVFYEMNLVFKAMLKRSLTEDDVKVFLFKEVKKKVCELCPEKARCHRTFCEDTSKAFDEIISKAFSKGKVSILDVPTFLNSRCDKVNLIISNINAMCTQYKKYSEIMGSIDASKLLIADQLYGISNVIKNLSKEVAINVSFDNVREEKIKEELSFNNIVCTDAIVYDKSIHEKEVSVVVRNEDQEKAVLPSIISQICDTKMLISSRTVALEPGWTNLTFRNAPKYDCVFGLSMQTKSGSVKSGDCHSEIRLSESKYLFALCDGMGTGEKAQETSNIAISLIENFYKAGYDNETILSSVNKLLLLQREENFSAIDICVVDLDSGIVDIIKMGSPSGYILAKDSIKIVEGGTLPLGIVGESKPLIKKYVIDENEYMIMLSDGISDSFANDRILCDFISRIKTRNPQEMADAIKEKALENNNGRAIDDMSVLVVKIFAC